MREKWKDGIRFGLGTLILIYETVIEQADRPWIVVAGLGLVGYSGVSKLARSLNSPTELE